MAIAVICWTETRFATNGEVRLAYDELVDSAGEPLLLIMGLAASRHWWPTGLCRRRGNPYSAEDLADDAIAVIDALGWDSAHLFGHSMGGAVAQRVALRHPTRVRTLTVSSSLPSDVAGFGAAIRGARLIIYPGVGHELPRPLWDTVAADVYALVDKCRTSAVG